MGRCGRCKGRGVVKPTTGFGDKECPACKGTGEKNAARSQLGKRTVSLGTPTGACVFGCGRKAAVFHHAVPQQRIDAQRHLDDEAKQAAKADIRDGVPVCNPCHGHVEDGHPDYLIREEHLHPAFPLYVAEYDLFGALPRHLMERAA